MLFCYFLFYSLFPIIPRMAKKVLGSPLSPTANTHVGLLQKACATSASAKWCSLGAISKKLQPNLFDNLTTVLSNSVTRRK